MSNIFGKKADKAIESAIKSASQKVCPRVDLDDFDPWNQKSQKDCHKRFDGEIRNKRHEISQDQDALVLISYSATLGWLYGYSCAQYEALSTISAEDDAISNQYDENKKSGHEQSNDRGNNTGKTEKAAKSKSDPDGKTDESEELESTDDGQLHQKLRRAKGCCWGLALAIVVAIIIILSDWPI